MPHLLEGDWTAPVRAFLEEQGGALQLRRVVHLHALVVDALNVWLREVLVATNTPKLAELNLLVDEVNAAMLGTDPDSAREILARRRAELARPRPCP